MVVGTERWLQAGIPTHTGWRALPRARKATAKVKLARMKTTTATKTADGTPPRNNRPHRETLVHDHHHRHSHNAVQDRARFKAQARATRPHNAATPLRHAPSPTWAAEQARACIRIDVGRGRRRVGVASVVTLLRPSNITTITAVVRRRLLQAVAAEALQVDLPPDVVRPPLRHPRASTKRSLPFKPPLPLCTSV